MKVMRVAVSLGECCCFPSSRTLPLNASPRLPSLRHHAPLGSPPAPRPPGPLASADGAVAVELVYLVGRAGEGAGRCRPRPMPHAEASTAPLLPCCLPPAPILSRSQRKPGGWVGEKMRALLRLRCASAIPGGLASVQAERDDEGDASRGQLGRVLLSHPAPKRLAPPPQSPAPCPSGLSAGSAPTRAFSLRCWRRGC